MIQMIKFETSLFIKNPILFDFTISWPILEILVMLQEKAGLYNVMTLLFRYFKQSFFVGFRDFAALGGSWRRCGVMEIGVGVDEAHSFA